MVGDADISTLGRLWYDSWLALPDMGLVAVLSLRLAVRSDWTATSTVVRLVGLALLIPAVLTVLDRSGVFRMDVYTDAFTYVGVVDTATAAIFAITAGRLGHLHEPDTGCSDSLFA